VVVDAEVKRTTKTTLRSGRRGLFKNDLTGPTLLEISGYGVYQALDSLTQKGRDLTSSPIPEGKLWRMKPMNLLLVAWAVLLPSRLAAQTASAGNHQSAENAAVKYLRADASLRQSYALPADAVPMLQKSLESPLDLEDEKLITAADEALVEFHHGTASSRCDWVMSSQDGPLTNTAHRGAMKELVAVVEIRSRLRFRDGDMPGAMDDAVAAIAAARHLSVDGSLASVLFAYKMENSVMGILSRNLLRLSSEQLRELATAINALPNGSDLKIALESEKLNRNDILDSVQGAKTRDDLIARLLRNIPFLKSNRELATQIVDGCGGSVKGFRDCVDQQQAFYISWASRFALAPEEFEKAYKLEFEKLSTANPLVWQFTPFLPRFRWTEAYEQTHRALLHTAIAVRLDGPRAVSVSPDPYDRKPFTYVALGEGFRLESRLVEGGIPISLSIMPSAEDRKPGPK